ncbi:MAG TPA: PDZ domain-containing protein [Gammaproteobacteria bacterium]|nr:PDZ domain-containing protein [Gammaproteobacteria bacterium]
MRNTIHTLGLTALVLGLASGGVFAQPAADDQPQQEQKAQPQAQKQQTQAQKTQQQAQKQAQKQQEQAQAEQERDQASVQRELERAREQLQQAAREIARLSSELTAPIVRDVQHQFRYRGQRSMLGFVTEDVERGVRVASVTPNGPAAEAGLKVGETVTEIDGARLTDTRATDGSKQSPTELLLARMANVDPGESVKLHVINEAGAERDITVKPRLISTNVFINTPAPPGAGSFSFSGPGNFWFTPNPWSQMQLVTLTSGLGSYFGTTKGLLVVRGPEDATLQLKDGDVILDIGGREPTSPEHAMRILGSFQKGEPLKITIMRNKSKQTLDVRLPA